MKVVERIKTGVYKGWTIRQSKHGWFSVYSSNGICQNIGKLESIEQVKEFFKSGNNQPLPTSR